MFAVCVSAQSPAAGVRRRAVKSQKRPPVILEKAPVNLKRAPVNLKQIKKRRKRPRRHHRRRSQLLLTGRVKPRPSVRLWKHHFSSCELGVSRCFLLLSLFLFPTQPIRQVCRSQEQMWSVLCCINKLKLPSVLNFSHFYHLCDNQPAGRMLPSVHFNLFFLNTRMFALHPEDLPGRQMMMMMMQKPNMFWLLHHFTWTIPQLRSGASAAVSIYVFKLFLQIWFADK